MRDAPCFVVNPSLQHLLKLVPPPTNPVAPGSPEGWKLVEDEMGTPLPQDFKDYTQAYGAGQWGDFFGIMNPFYKWKHPHASKSWKQWFEKRFEGFTELQRDYPKYQVPFSFNMLGDWVLTISIQRADGTKVQQDINATVNEQGVTVKPTAQ